MNKVFQYFKDHPNVAFSVTTIANRLNLKRGYVNWLLQSAENTQIQRVDPLCVGSHKTSLRVYKYGN